MLLQRVLVAALLSIALSAHAVEENTPDDVYLEGYIRYILEQELFWEESSYKLTVKQGNVVLAMTESSPVKRAQAINSLYEAPGINDVQVVFAKPHELMANKPLARGRTMREKLLISLGADPKQTTLPKQDLFLPLHADPKQPQFYAAIQNHVSENKGSGQLSVGFGENFGLIRSVGFAENHFWQLSVVGGLFGQFAIEDSDVKLINQDFNIGASITYAHFDWSHRFRVYHQSSHLGDEFLLDNPTDIRYDFNFESIEWLASYQKNQFRYYGGFEFMMRRWPFPLDRWMGHVGAEYHGAQPSLFGGRWLTAIDIKSWQEYNWSPDISIKTGLQFGDPNRAQRQLRWLIEYYNGNSPHGQFFRRTEDDSTIEYIGAGIYFSF